MIENGFYVVFEGIDGSGKTSIAKRVFEMACERDPEEKWVLTSEPRNWKIAEEYKDKPAYAAGYAFAYDRVETMEEIVGPALSQGCTVLSDRSYLSNLAYQGAAGMSMEWGMRIQPPNLILPWLVIFLQCDPEIAASRAIPQEDPHRLEHIAAAYETAFHMPRPLPVVRINTGVLGIEEAANFAYQAIKQHREHAYFAARKVIHQ